MKDTVKIYVKLYDLFMDKNVYSETIVRYCSNSCPYECYTA